MLAARRLRRRRPPRRGRSSTPHLPKLHGREHFLQAWQIRAKARQHLWQCGPYCTVSLCWRLTISSGRPKKSKLWSARSLARSSTESRRIRRRYLQTSGWRRVSSVATAAALLNRMKRDEIVRRRDDGVDRKGGLQNGQNPAQHLKTDHTNPSDDLSCQQHSN